jgi:uncharacterized protein
MDRSLLSSEKFFITACYFESALLVLALILGWLADIDPFQNLFFSEKQFSYGLIATLPLIFILFVLQVLPYQSLRNIRGILNETLGAPLYSRHWTDLLILACIAGFSEEILFRGFLQPWLESFWDEPGGLIASNLIFAAVHAITPLYALLAFLTGLYLGICLDLDNQRAVIIPITVHAFYDFVAFTVILRDYRISNLQK